MLRYKFHFYLMEVCQCPFHLSLPQTVTHNGMWHPSISWPGWSHDRLLDVLQYSWCYFDALHPRSLLTVYYIAYTEYIGQLSHEDILHFTQGIVFLLEL